MKKEKLFSLSKKDFEIQTFCSGGPGGQHQNKTESGVRIIHKESKARGESREQKSQHANKKIALKRLTESKEFKIWLNRRVHEITEGKTIDVRVDEQMINKNLKIEMKDEAGKWVDEKNLITKNSPAIRGYH